MWLNALWFALFVVILAGYLILDGFDLGVGMLHPVTARGDTERRLVLNSIGPIWDGNEVWLVVAGGVLFAAFPIVYASLFSGFYWAMMLVLLGLILRTVAIEFRGKRAEAAWRGTWDTVFFVSSLALALLLGVAFGLVIRMASRGRETAAFFSSAAMVALLLATLAAGLYPNLLTSTTDPRYSLTITNAASASGTLTVMLVVAVIGMPFVLLYTVGVQYIFRGKVRLKSDSY